jgi:Domain of unknown function (DUF6901)
MPQDKSTRAPDIEILYNIWLSNDRKLEFPIRLDGESLCLLIDNRRDNPDWTRLVFYKCPNCTLDQARSPHCPVAVNLVDIIGFFREVPSYEEVDVSVVCSERKYVKHTSVQYVVGSLIGLYMITSGCPVLDRFRPLAGSHLPFVTLEEYSRRLFALYMSSRYVSRSKGEKPDWELNGLAGMLAEAETVNGSFCMRLSSIRAEGGDACLNAVNNLNSMNVLARMSLENDPPEFLKTFERCSEDGIYL